MKTIMKTMRKNGFLLLLVVMVTVAMVGFQNARADLVVSNGSFESALGPPPWYIYTSATSPAVYGPSLVAVPHTGDNSLMIATDSDDDSSLYHGSLQWLGAGSQFEANTEYTLHIWARRHWAYTTFSPTTVSLWALGGSGAGTYGGTRPIEINIGIYPPDGPDWGDAWKEYTGTVSTQDYPELVDQYAAVSIVLSPSITANSGWNLFDDVSISSVVIPEPPAPPELRLFLLGDANGDGVVSAGDYASIQANFGNTVLSSSSSTPEPATMSLLLAGGMIIARRRKR